MTDCCNIYQSITISFISSITLVIIVLIMFQYKKRRNNLYAQYINYNNDSDTSPENTRITQNTRNPIDTNRERIINHNSKLLDNTNNYSSCTKLSI